MYSSDFVLTGWNLLLLKNMHTGRSHLRVSK